MVRPEYIGTGDFSIAMKLEKTREVQKDDGTVQLFISGLASSTGIDLQDERMADTAVQAFKKAIDDGMVLPNGKWSLIPLRSGHRKEWDDILGHIVKADIDGEHNLWIEAELDQENSNALNLYRKLQAGDRPGKPLMLGLSVGGSIKKASHEWNATMNKRIRVIEDVTLKEISVVGQPANPATYVEALTKSVNWDEVPVSREELALQKELPMSNEKEQANADAQNVENTATEEVTLDTQKSDTNVSEGANSEAQTSESEGEVSKDISYYENAANIADLIVKMQAQIDDLKSAFSAGVVKSEEGGETAKSAEETTPVVTPETTEKSTNSEDTIVTAITAAFAAFKKDVFDPFASKVEGELDTVKSNVEEVASSPVYKALSVQQAKGGEQDALQKFHEKIDSARANPKGHFSIIGEAVRQAVRQND